MEENPPVGMVGMEQNQTAGTSSQFGEIYDIHWLAGLVSSQHLHIFVGVKTCQV